MGTTPGASLALLTDLKARRTKGSQTRAGWKGAGAFWRKLEPTATQPPPLAVSLGEVTKPHLRRNKLISDLYKTALMTKQLKIPLGAFLVPSNVPCAVPRPLSQAWEDEELLRHLLPVQHIPREGSVLETHQNPLQDPPLRTIFLPAPRARAADASVTRSWL